MDEHRVDFSKTMVSAEDTANSPRGRLAGFWMRFFADILDALVLGAAGWMLSLPFRSTFLQWGEQGVFVGLAVSMAYTGLLHSRIGGGRTIGKRLLGLRVVRPDGALLSLDRSLVRYALMGLLVYQGAVAYAVTAVLPFLRLEWVETAVNGMAIVLMLGCVALVPFHPLKRGLHDLLAGTIVIRGGMPDPVFIQARMNQRRDRGIVAGATVLLLAAIAGSLVVSSRLAGSGQLSSAMTAVKRLQDLGVSNPGVGSTTVTGGGTSTVNVTVSGFLPRPADGGEPPWAAMQEKIRSVIKATPLVTSETDRVAIVLRTGFNIGIYRSYETVVQTYDPRTSETPPSQPQQSAGR